MSMNILTLLIQAITKKKSYNKSVETCNISKVVKKCNAIFQAFIFVISSRGDDRYYTHNNTNMQVISNL
jgi:hypothetical protein